MEDILKKLSDHAKERVESKKVSMPLSQVRAIAESMPKGWYPFLSAMNKPYLSFICEVKKASPSKGVISNDFPYLDIAKEYEAAGADAVSVLTEPKWFLGNEDYLEEISENIRIPILRKDFIVDPYMIYEAKTIGASAVLLITSILEENELREYINIGLELGLTSLVEVHDIIDIEKAVSAGAEVIGVNNRNLVDFSIDPENAKRLRMLVPRETKFVVESGITGAEGVVRAKQIAADAVLIGEAFMRAHNKAEFLKTLKEA